MKIWLDSNYSIIKTDGNSQFGQGNISFDRIEVCIPTDSVVNDNTLPHFNFLLSNGRKVGPFVHNINSHTEGEYTVFTYVLDDIVLSCAGFLQITIAINWYDSSGNVTRVRNISAVGNVVANVVIYDDILIVGSAKATIECHSDDIKALDQRISTVSTAAIGNVTATVDSNVGTPSVLVSVDKTNPRSPNVSLSFKGLKGEQGVQGERGPRGYIGPQGVKGDNGQSFSIKKIYSSINEMNNNYATDGLAVGDLVAIVSSVDDADNAKLYVKGNTAYNFLVDMSGATGIQGPKGEQGPRGDSGVTAPIGSMFTLYVDENGDLYSLSNDEETPKFEYDSDTGNLYVVHDDTGYTINYANGDDLVYGSN